MAQVQLPLPNGSFKHPSVPTNNQLCINYFPVTPGPEGRGVVTLLPTAGSQVINSGAVGEIRFLKRIDNIVYVVIGNKFYSSVINLDVPSMTLTEEGTLVTETGTVIGTNNPTQIILMDGEEGYIYNITFAGTVTLGPIGGTAGDDYSLNINGTGIYTAFNVATALTPTALVNRINLFTGTTGVTASYVGGLLTLSATDTTPNITVIESGTGFVSGTDGITVSNGVFASSLPFFQFQAISDPDFVPGTHVVYIDGYFINNNTGTQKFQFSQPNEGRIWNALDVASAESKPDNVVALGETKGELWVFGSNSIEVWFDAANPVGSPFSKRDGSDIDIGCQAPYSVTNVNDLLVWLDTRGFIVQSDISALFREQSTGYTLTKISNEAIDTELFSYPTLSDAIGCSYVDRGHVMYEITFPSANKTWVYDFISKAWHEKQFHDSFDDSDVHSLNQYCDIYNNTVISGGIRDSRIYILSPDYYYDDLTPISRTFTTAHYNKDFKIIGVDSLELKMETGFGAMEGPLSETQVMMQFSNDSGFSWSYEMQRPIGKLGQYMKRIIWNMLGSSYEWLFKFRVTAPIRHTVVDMTANINIEGD